MLRLDSGLAGSRRAARSAADSPVEASAVGRVASTATTGLAPAGSTLPVVEQAASRHTVEAIRVWVSVFFMAMSIDGWLELPKGQGLWIRAAGRAPGGLEWARQAWIAHCLACHVPVILIFNSLFTNKNFCIFRSWCLSVLLCATCAAGVFNGAYYLSEFNGKKCA